MKILLKVSLKYGVIAGAIACIALAGLYALDRHPLLIPVFIDSRIIIFGVFIFFTLREIRDHYQGGILYFWQGIFGSFLFTLSFAILASLFIVIFVSIVPGFLQDYIQLTVAQLRSLPKEVIDRIGEDVYQRNLQLLPTTDVWDLALLYFGQSLLISLFISIILSVILRRQPKT